MKGNQIQLYLIMLLATGLLTGCSAGPVEEIVPEESQLVTLSFGKPDLGVPKLLTRAGKDVTSTPLPNGTTVRICAYFTGNVGNELQEAYLPMTEPSFEATYVVGIDGKLTPCLVNDKGEQIDGDAKGLTVRGGMYDFYAVSPARPLQREEDNCYKITGIPHKEDVMTSIARGVAVTKDSHQVTLGVFQRKCALIVFNVVPSSNNTLSFKKLHGTELVIKRISSSGADLVAGSDTGIHPTGGGSGEEAQVVFMEEEFKVVESESDPNSLGLNKTKGVVLPKTNEPFDVEIKVVRDDETATLKATIDSNISFDEGKRYIFTLEVNNNESTLLMRVLDWNAIVFKDDNVGGSDNLYPDPDINEGIGSVIKVATWNVINWTGNGDVGGNETI